MAERIDELGFLAGGGDLGARMRETDWSGTPLGPAAAWPRSLKTIVRIMLTSSQPIWVGWGPELIYLYNDPYKSIIGGKHPAALGRPTAEVWREIWRDIEPLLDSAIRGDGTYVESQLLIMERNGYPEETYYTFSYSPIPDDDGRAAGIICANSDDTVRVVGERRMGTLRDLAAAAEARTVKDAFARSAAALCANGRDVPFALLYARDGAEGPLALVAGTPPAGDGTDADALQDLWQAEAVLAEHRPHQVVPLPPATWPAGLWDLPPRQALVLPVARAGDAGPQAVLVVGLSPMRLLDERYLDFLQLAAGQIAASVANAHAYEAEQRRAEALAELDRAKTQFFSNISHEFRTPLTLMSGPLADALSHPGLPGELRDTLAMAERNAARLTKLVNALLEFSRIEAGRHRASVRAVDLCALTRDVASTFRSAMERGGLGFHVDCESLPQPAYVDPDLWERVVLNLLSNAFKYTLEGEVQLLLREDSGRALLRVRDTGVGIPAPELPKLFQRFHRVEGSHGRTHEGSGIGLALVQELVRLHGGSIRARSVLGQGSEFTVELPLGRAHLPPELFLPEPSASPGSVDERPGAPRVQPLVEEALHWLPAATARAGGNAPQAADVPGTRPGRDGFIVLADDNADMREYLTQLLSGHYEVLAVADGQQALDALRRRRPTLLVTDVMMPRLDGFQLLAAVRADAALRVLPVILLSARAGDEARIEGLNAGADDYIVKPFGARELLARVSGVIALDRVRRNAEEHLRLGLASARMFLWDVELKTGRVAMSSNASEVLGAPPQRQLSDAMALVHPDDVERHRAVLNDVVARRGELQDEIRLVRPDTGEVRWMQLRARVVCGEDGEPQQLSGISFDITDAKRAELEREQLHATVQEQSRRKDVFLAMLAHELRNPLAPIRTSAELLLRVTDDPRAQQPARIIARQAQQLTRLVDDLLDVSRITQGRIQLERGPVDLQAVIDKALETVEAQMSAKGHAVSVLSRRERLTVEGDEARLQQCLVNLLSNAAKYTDAGGAISVELRRDGEEAVIAVADNGCGMAEDLRRTVFDIFVQSDRTLDRAQGGLGIGLSVVRSLVEMHGGTVQASSAGPNLGSVFELRLPLREVIIPEVETAEPMASRRLRILVVDDNPDAAETLALMLEMDGHDVCAVNGSRDALRAVEGWVPEVALLDLGLPEMDGFELIARLKAQPALAHTHYIALSGYGQASDRERTHRAGFHLHLVKPADLDELRQALAGAAA